MKSLLIILVLFPSLVLAENWIAESDIPAANAQTPGVVGFQTQPACQSAKPGNTCYEFTGHNLRYEKIVSGSWVEDAALKAAFDAEQADVATNFGAVLFSGFVSGGPGNNCTADPCSVERRHPKPPYILSANRTAQGDYTINTITFQEPPVCTVTQYDGTPKYCNIQGQASNNAIRVKCYSTLFVLTDARFSLVCTGKK